MLKRFVITLLLSLLLQSNANAQDPLARLKYMDAEEAFAAGNFKLAIRKLDEAELLLGSSNPKILFLRIMAQDQLLQSFKDIYSSIEYFDVLNNFRENCNKYINTYDTPELADKILEVYKVLEKYKQFPSNRSEFEAKVKSQKEEQDRLKRQKETQERLKREKEEREREEEEEKTKRAEQRRLQEIKQTNKYTFGNLGIQSGTIGKYGILFEEFDHEKSMGFRMAFRASLIAGKNVKKFDNTYKSMGITKEGKFEIDLGTNIRILHPLYIFAGIGFGSYSKWTRYEVYNNGYYDSEIWGSFEDENQIIYLQNSIGLMLRLGRIVNINTGFAFMNLKQPELTFGLSFNLLAKM